MQQSEGSYCAIFGQHKSRRTPFAVELDQLSNSVDKGTNSDLVENLLPMV
jgi:hypothetical protein